MANITAQLQNKIKQFVNLCDEIHMLSIQLYKAYWSTDASILVGAMADGDAVSVSTKLTKEMFVNGISICENFNKFFMDLQATQADYCAHVVQIHYGKVAAASIISEATEAIATDLKNMADTIMAAHKMAIQIQEMYWDCEFGSAIEGMSASTVMFGGTATKQNISDAVTLMNKFCELCENISAAKADFDATIVQWQAMDFI